MGKRSPHEATAEESRPTFLRGALCRHSTPYPLKSLRALSASRTAPRLSMCGRRRTSPPTLASFPAPSAGLTRLYRPGRRNSSGRSAVVICEKGQKLSEGVAAWLRHAGASSAESSCWRPRRLGGSGPAARPRRQTAAARSAGAHGLGDARQDRKSIASPVRGSSAALSIPAAVFLFVSPAEVQSVAERFNGAPFDIEGVFWSHRGEKCTFDMMVEEFGLRTEPLARLATLVRGADTARLDLAPEAPGLLAASLGFRACTSTISSSSRRA